jgi:hypothetical protein
VLDNCPFTTWSVSSSGVDRRRLCFASSALCEPSARFPPLLVEGVCIPDAGRPWPLFVLPPLALDFSPREGFVVLRAGGIASLPSSSKVEDIERRLRPLREDA